MTGSVLLITGSRALASTPEAATWARAQLTRVLTPRVSVVAGDAGGPDEWAQVMAPGWATRWCLDGRIFARLTLSGSWQLEARWHSDPMPSRGDRAGWKMLCLARDRAMVAHWAERAGVSMLALVAPFSRTRGTQYTVARAREAGIPTTVLTCPAEYGPRAEVTK